MSVNKDESGRRWVQSEVEVPGTPEEVWAAIATGPGVSSWFFPTEIDEREGGKVVCNMGGMETAADITKWDPPRQLHAESQWYPESPMVGTEWTVEAQAGGTCIVRVVHSLFADTDDWDNQLESTEPGWEGFFGVLRLYLAHFGGQPCTNFAVASMVPGSDTDVWSKITGAFGLKDAQAGQDWNAPESAPEGRGTVERMLPGRGLVRLTAPNPGIASITVFGMGEVCHTGISFFLYGDGAADAAEREQAGWQSWMEAQFPAAPA